MIIPCWNYVREYESEKKETLEAVESVLSSGQLILGENVIGFEREFSSYCGTEFGIGVASGTDAIFLALKALGVGIGDEVVTVANTAVPTVSAIVSTGATPRFVDIDSGTYLIDVQEIERVLNKNTRCILPVHLYGQCANMDEIQRIAAAHGLYVVEDCAQAHSATFKGQMAGSMSDLGAFSFYPTKLLGTYGDGGMVITGKKSLEVRLRRLRFYGMNETYYSKEHGYNSRLDELHAAILRVKLNKLQNYVEKRRALADRYNEALIETSLVLPLIAPNSDHTYCLYVCRHPDRNNIISELSKKAIHLNIHYPWPVHLMEGYQYLGYRESDLPNTEKSAKEVFSLPMYSTLTFSEQDQVIDALRKLC